MHTLAAVLFILLVHSFAAITQHSLFYFPTQIRSAALTRASLSNYNQELVACIEDLREKREELNRSILRDEEEKSKIQKELSTLTERLSRLNEDLARKMQARAHRRPLQRLVFVFARTAPHRLLLTRTPSLPRSLGNSPILRLQARVEFDQTIQETEAAYMKILESSQTLLSVLKRESVNLTKRKTASS